MAENQGQILGSVLPLGQHHPGGALEQAHGERRGRLGRDHQAEAGVFQVGPVELLLPHLQHALIGDRGGPPQQAAAEPQVGQNFVAQHPRKARQPHPQDGLNGVQGDGNHHRGLGHLHIVQENQKEVDR